MKGLLLKELYVTLKSFRMYFIIDAVFIAISFIVDNGVMFLVYPLLMSGIIPISLLNFDERSKWIEYSGALPYSPAQIVSSKYIYGLLFEVFSAVVTFAFMLLHVNVVGAMPLADSLVTFGGMVILSFVIPSTSLPFCFRYGTEKGRLVYFVFIFILTWLFFKLEGEIYTMQFDKLVWIIVSAVVFLYVLSWLASVSLYKRRTVKG